MRGASPAKDLELRQQRLCDYLVDLVSATDTAEPGVVKGESVYSRVERLLSSQSASASVPSSSTLSTSGLDVSSFINKRSTGNEVCALHLSVWKNDLKMVNLLLDYGADPDVTDGESGWSSLHRATWSRSDTISSRICCSHFSEFSWRAAASSTFLTQSRVWFSTLRSGRLCV